MSTDRAASGRLRAASGRCPGGVRTAPCGSGRLRTAFSRTRYFTTVAKIAILSKKTFAVFMMILIIVLQQHTLVFYLRSGHAKAYRQRRKDDAFQPFVSLIRSSSVGLKY